MQMGMTIRLFCSNPYRFHIQEIRRFPAPGYVAESRFRGRIWCWCGVVFRVLFLSGTELFLAYFPFHVVGLNETLFSRQIRRPKAASVNSKKDEKKRDFQLTKLCVRFNVVV